MGRRRLTAEEKQQRKKLEKMVWKAQMRRHGWQRTINVRLRQFDPIQRAWTNALPVCSFLRWADARAKAFEWLCERSIELAEARDAGISHWTQWRKLPLYCRAWSPTGGTNKRIGIWFLDVYGPHEHEHYLYRYRDVSPPFSVVSRES